jgi:hypothetical protein
MTTVIMPRLTPLFVRLDWDDDGTYTGTYDDVTADTLPGVSIELGRDQGRVIGGPKVPKASSKLLNESKRYATEYSGSPLHGKLQPGHRITYGRWLGDDTIIGDDTIATGDDPEALGDGYAEVTIFTGRTLEPVEHYQLGQRAVEVSALGTTQRLINTNITWSNGALVDYTTGAAMVVALTQAGLGGNDYVIDQDAIDNGYTLRQWIVDDEPAWDVCRRIWASSGPPSALYETPDGKIHFEGRNYRTITDRCLTVQQTFSDTAAELYFADLDYAPSYDSVVNDMTIEVQTRATQVNQQVWVAGVATAVGAGATVDLLARVDDPIIDIDTPIAVTDYVLTGTAPASITVTQLSPYTYRIRIVGGAGSATLSGVGTNTGLQLRAKPVPVVSRSQVMGTFDTTASIAAYGNHKQKDEISGSIWQNMSEAHAAALIDGYLVAYQAPRAAIVMAAENATGLLLYEMLRRQISDRIHIADSWSGVALDVTIEQIQHDITTDNLHRVTLTCERVVELTWARWDVGRWDVDKWGQ